MSRPLIAGNWKMNGSIGSVLGLARSIGGEAAIGHPGVELAVFPSFPHLPLVVDELSGSPVAVGAQNMHWESDGAFTGEVSASMPQDLGCSMVLIGHSERRHLFGESDEVLRRKLETALATGLRPILCIGETEAEREDGLTGAVLERQLVGALDGLDLAPGVLDLAYEPVWAIGTGRTATPEIVVQAHRDARSIAARIQGTGWAGSVRILYGGSVKPSNSRELLACEGVDGVLVGGASLVAGDFLAIAASAEGGS